MQQTKVIVGLDQDGVHSEVIDFLTRLPRVRVVATSTDAPSLERGVRDEAPDAAVVSPRVLREADLDGAAILVVAEHETTEALRSALAAGARGFFLWPEDREALARAAERASRPPAAADRPPGRVVAVHGPRGGAGVTFLATNLAGACAGRGASTVIVDLDPFYGEVAAALGIPPTASTPTIADLEPVLAEISPEHLGPVLYEHPRGFRALLGPEEPGAVTLDGPRVSALVRALRSSFDITVLHLPRSLDGSTVAAMEIADEILVVVTLDVLAFRDARRTLSFLRARGVDDRCRLVVNRAARAEVAPEDAEQVFGIRPFAVIRVDRSVGRAQNRGELLAGRSGHAARRVSALAERILAERSVTGA